MRERGALILQRSCLLASFSLVVLLSFFYYFFASVLTPHLLPAGAFVSFSASKPASPRTFPAGARDEAGGGLLRALLRERRELLEREYAINGGALQTGERAPPCLAMMAIVKQGRDLIHEFVVRNFLAGNLIWHLSVLET